MRRLITHTLPLCAQAAMSRKGRNLAAAAAQRALNPELGATSAPLSADEGGSGASAATLNGAKLCLS